MADKRSQPPVIRFGLHGAGRRHMMAEVVKPQDRRGALRRLWVHLAPYRMALFGIAALVAATTGLALLGPVLIRQAIDKYILPGDLPGLARLMAIMAVVYLAAAAGTWVQRVSMIRISQGMVRDIRRELFAKLQTLSLRYFDQRSHGDLMSRLTNDTDMVSSAMGESVAQMVSSLLSVVGAGTLMFVLNWRLALVSLATLPLVAWATEWIARGTRQGFRDRQDSLGALNGIVEENVLGQRAVKVCLRGADVVGRFDESNTDLKRKAIRAFLFVGLMGPVMGLFRNTSFAIVAGVGGWMVIKDMATIGTIAAFLNYSRYFTRPLHEIASLYGTLQTALAGAERVFDVMDEVPEISDTASSAAMADLRGEIIFDHVVFGYVKDVPVLKDVSFRAEAGQTVALVGHTGAGKTTVINLLTRFYDVNAGSILLDGRDIRNLSKDALRQSLGIVLQDTFLFAETVRENIRYGRLDATDGEIEAAARMANAEHFIRHLPNGFDTVLSEDAGTLSQGQRQLLAIARAILADPAVLILDEATSSVDVLTERHIREAMARLMKGRTSLVIAHRLSTIRDADVILVMDQGQIVERGTHEDLMARRGFYYKLYMSQFSIRSVGA